MLVWFGLDDLTRSKETLGPVPPSCLRRMVRRLSTYGVFQVFDCSSWSGCTKNELIRLSKAISELLALNNYELI
jgi:hypothetical protein